MSSATCKTCPWWEGVDDTLGTCHHVSAQRTPDLGRPDYWGCSEHPDRKRPNIHETARAAMAAMVQTDSRDKVDMSWETAPVTTAVAAYDYAIAMMAEWERRKGQVS